MNRCPKCHDFMKGNICNNCGYKEPLSVKQEFSHSLTCEKCGKKGRYTRIDEKTRQPLPPILCYECTIASHSHDFYRARFDGTYSNPVEALDVNKRAEIQSKQYWGEKVQYDDDEYLRAIFIEFGKNAYEKAKAAMETHKNLVAEGYTNQQALKEITGNLKPSEFKKICERLE